MPRRNHWTLPILVLFCLVGSLTAFWLLLSDYEKSAGEAKDEPLGVVFAVGNDVQRKTRTSYLWIEVEQGMPLFAQDSIQTGAGSFASIRLKDGSILELGEDTLVRIEPDMLHPENRVSRGSM